MKWEKVVYAVIIVLLYLPLVFLGVNVFFPETDYPQVECPPRAVDGDNTASEECFQEFEKDRRAYQEERRSIEGWKYFSIVIVNFIALLVALAPLSPSIVYGLFMGSTLATFFSTWIYFDARSIPGFIVLLLLFALTIFFIQRLSKKKK